MPDLWEKFIIFIFTCQLFQTVSMTNYLLTFLYKIYEYMENNNVKMEKRGNKKCENLVLRDSL